MANVSVYNMDGQQVGNIDLNDAVFGVEVNEHLLHKARVTVLANTENAIEEATAIVGKDVVILATNSAIRGNLTYIIFDTDKKIPQETLLALNDKFVKARMI